VAEGELVSGSELRRELQERLPEYMVPTVIMVLEKLPLTANGKVNREGLPAPDGSRPEMAAAYVEPRNGMEEILAGIWSEVLRVERVGIYDNFFELGGDSILSIQIIARANQRGVRLSPRQLFQHQTIAGLGQVAVAGPALLAEQGAVQGEVPLTPIQRWFFGQELPERHHFNQSVLLRLRQRWEPALLQRVMQHLVDHHDALRLRYEVQADGDWRQFYGAHEEPEVEEQEVCTFHDLSGLGASEQSAALAEVGEQLQRSLSLRDGPLVRVGLFELGESGGSWPQRVLIIMHHLVVDGVSWRILLEDLQTAYGQARSGAVLKLPAKTSSYQQWAERLAVYAASGAAEQELGYWRRQVAAGAQQRLPVDYPGGGNTVGSMRVVTIWLSAEETTGLLREVPAAYHTQINDVLLTALVRAFRRWTGRPGLLVELESHGREESFEEIDVTRTVGWFTSAYPAWLELSGSGDSVKELREIKEQLREAPGRGVGYGVSRYLGGADGLELAAEAERAQVCFNYLGQFDQVFEEEGVWGVAGERSGAVRSESGERKRLLEINGSVVSGRLQMSWSYSQEVHRRETIEQLATSYKEALQEFIAQSLTGTAACYLPSDFPLAKLDARKVSKVAALLEAADEAQVMVAT
jgi:non-ribosomal peptide synthase protein (TIGR01720 family)